MSAVEPPRRRGLRGRLQAAASRKVRFWTFGHDVIFWGDSRQKVKWLGPSFAPFKVVQGRQAEEVTVGRYTGVHATVTIIPGSEHHVDWVGTLHGYVEDGQWRPSDEDAFAARGPVVIGNDVWVGYEALILSGVTIGDGAVIAARSLVRKPVEPYEIIGGNPGKHIGWRFDEPTREALLRIKWWDWSDEKVADHRKQISSPEVQDFIDGHDPALGSPSCPLCAAG